MGIPRWNRVDCLALPFCKTVKKTLLLLGSIAASIVFPGCATRPSGNVLEKAYRNLAFASPNGKKLKLDLYVPQQKSTPPLVIWIHGGGWRYGDKRLRFFARSLTDQGFAVATVQYRLTWSAHWPAQKEDCLAAYDWLRNHASQYGYDGSRIGLAGDSAGGLLAALLGVLEGAPRVRAVAAFYPVTDCVQLGERFRDNKRNLLVRLFGGSFEETKDAAFEASPINHVKTSSPPFLMIHGDHDETVPLDQSKRMQQRLQKDGVDAELIVVPGKGHGFSPRKADMEAMIKFFSRQLITP